MTSDGRRPENSKSSIFQQPLIRVQKRLGTEEPGSEEGLEK